MPLRKTHSTWTRFNACNSPSESSSDKIDPSDKSRHLANYIIGKISNSEASNAFSSLAEGDPQERHRLLKRLATKAQIKPCPLLKVYEPVVVINRAPGAQAPGVACSAQLIRRAGLNTKDPACVGGIVGLEVLSSDNFSYQRDNDCIIYQAAAGCLSVVVISCIPFL